jgi:cytidine deaminase
MVDPATLAQLLSAARTAQRRAHAPYSDFPVGAALLTAEGRVIGGCNVENASYGLCNCAERVAIGRFVAEGHWREGRGPLVCLVVGPKPEPLTPCGACRQVLLEFNPDMLVIAVGSEGATREFSLRQLLPASFGADAL